MHQIEHEKQHNWSIAAFEKVGNRIEHCLIRVDVSCAMPSQPLIIFALQIKAETHLRAKMNPADREKLKVALLEPMWQALDMSRTAITAVLPARIDRWGIEYDARWLPYFRLIQFLLPALHALNVIACMCRWRQIIIKPECHCIRHAFW